MARRTPSRGGCRAEAVRGAGTGQVLPVCRVDAAIHPAAAGGGAVVLGLLVARDLLAVGDGVAIDLAQHGFRVRLAPLAALPVVPGQRLDSRVGLHRAAGIELLKPLAQMIDELKAGPAVARRVQHHVVPLHQAAGVGDGAVLFPDKAEGRKNTSVPMSAGVVSPFCTRRPFCQKFAVSVIAKSRTTIHSSLARPRSTISELTAPTAGFWPRMNCPLMTPVVMANVIGSCDTSPVSLGMKS